MSDTIPFPTPEPVAPPVYPVPPAFPGAWYGSYAVSTAAGVDTYTGTATDGSGFSISVPAGTPVWQALNTTPPASALLPDTVALWKIKIILSEQPSAANAGKTLLDDANTAVAAASMATQIAWANAADVALTSPTLAGIAAALGMPTEEVATLYAAACAVSL